MGDLNILPFSPKKNKGWLYHLLIYSKMAIMEIESYWEAFLSGLYKYTNTLLISLSLFLPNPFLPSPVYSCCFALYLSCVSLGMWRNKYILTHCVFGSMNIIQWHEDFFFPPLDIFLLPRAKMDLQKCTSLALELREKSSIILEREKGRIEQMYDQRCN